jgi:putative modified peptide
MPSPSHLSTVLDKLANDGAFRAELAHNPVAALAGLGITLNPAAVPAVRSLPSGERIAADLAALKDKLESAAAMVPFRLSGTA